jgi:regulator of protease activity HflC (stomatin/prohibitin superfamily)
LTKRYHEGYRHHDENSLPEEDPMSHVSRHAFLRHLRGAPTTWVHHQVRGRVRHQGSGLSFWYRPLAAVISEVPVDDRELPLLCHARTADYCDVTVQATVTYRIAEPARAAERLDFAIDPYQGHARARPLEQVAALLTELAQQPVLDLLARMPLTDALTAGVRPVREAMAAALDDDERLAGIGVTVVSARVVAIRPEPELERALQTPTREAVQADADRATHARRAHAVEQERAIAENELQSKIELARREQQLVEQRGANDRRRNELAAATELVTVQGQAAREQVATAAAAERARMLATADADRERTLAAAEADKVRTLAAAEAEKERAHSAARADGVRAVGLAEAEGETARMGAYRDVAPAVLNALAVRDVAGHLPDIGQVTITPDVLTGLLAQLAGRER